MVNVNKLKGKMVEMGINAADVSAKIGINEATFYRRLAQGGDGFTVREVDVLARELQLTKDEVNAVFFSQFVA